MKIEVKLTPGEVKDLIISHINANCSYNFDDVKFIISNVGNKDNIEYALIEVVLEAELDSL